MHDLIPRILAQAGSITSDLGWMVAALTSTVALIGLFGKWITSAFTAQLQQHALQMKERDATFAAQMDRRDAVQSRHADILQDHTRVLAVLVLEWSRNEEGDRSKARDFAEQTIARIDEQKAGR